VALRVCKVSFRRADGGFHSVEVEAETVYEAVLLALSSLTPHESAYAIEPDTRVNVRVVELGPPRTATVAEIRAWLDLPSLNPSETATRRRLRGLLAS
jgi:hypothetical protein